MKDSRIDDSVMWSAVRDALRADTAAHGSSEQWIGVADYAARRGVDPWPARAAEIGGRFGGDTDVMSALNHAAALMTKDPGDSPLRAELLGWLKADFATAGPLLSVFTGHGTDVEHPVIAVNADEIAKLAAWLSQEHGKPLTVDSAEIIGGGFSRRMWRVKVHGEGIDRRVIVRVEQGGMFGTDTMTEVHAMRGLLKAGYKVPAVLHVEATGNVLGEPFFVMEEVAGEVRLDDEGLNDIIRSVRDLHQVPVAAIDDTGRTPEQVVNDNIDYWLGVYRTHSPIPVPLIEQGAAWLRLNLKPTGPSVIVHGDAGPGNALFHPEHGLTVLDWEFAHVGDAAEDWAYLALIRGRRTMSADEWKSRLRETIVLDYDEEQWRTWLAYNHFRGACVNLTALTVFTEGTHRTADQLAIGIAVHLRFLSQLVEITCA